MVIVSDANNLINENIRRILDRRCIRDAVEAISIITCLVAVLLDGRGVEKFDWSAFTLLKLGGCLADMQEKACAHYWHMTAVPNGIRSLKDC